MIDRDTFIALARDAGFVHSNPHSEVIVRHSSGAWVSIEERLHQFAALVADAEREACAQLCDIRETMFKGYKTDGLAALCAAAIRARSQQ